VHAATWPVVSSTQALSLAENWRVFTYGAVALTLLVWALILYPAIRFRQTAKHREPRSQKDTNTPLEIAWTIAPLLVVIGLFVYTARVEAGVEAVAVAPAVRLHVNAFRWGWTFAYRDGPSITGTANRPPEIDLPVGETSEISATSSDVAHSFWVPDMLFKRDAIPGRVTTFDLTPSKVGTYIGRCGEFCGLDHALMTFQLHVVPPDEYRRWLRYEATQG
jgi:cytochrome c oxidase subunit 2